jgi:hypothetical protein
MFHLHIHPPSMECGHKTFTQARRARIYLVVLGSLHVFLLKIIRLALL